MNTGQSVNMSQKKKDTNNSKTVPEIMPSLDLKVDQPECLNVNFGSMTDASMSDSSHRIYPDQDLTSATGKPQTPHVQTNGNTKATQTCITVYSEMTHDVEQYRPNEHRDQCVTNASTMTDAGITHQTGENGKLRYMIYTIIVLLCGILASILYPRILSINAEAKDNYFINTLNTTLNTILVSNQALQQMAAHLVTYQQNNEKKLNEWSAFKSSLEREHRVLEAAFADVRSDITNLKTTIEQHQGDNINVITGLENKIRDAHTTLSKSDTKRELKLKEVSEQCNSYRNSLNHLLAADRNDVKANLKKTKSENQEAIEAAKLDTSKQIQHAQTEIQRMDDILRKMQIDKNEREVTKDIAEQIQSAQIKAEDTLHNIQEAQSEIEKKLEVQEQLLDIVYQNTFNKVSLMLAVLLLYLLFMALAICVFRLSKRSNQDEESFHHVKGFQNNVNAPGAANTPNANLANAVCVISFDEDTQKHHRRLMASVTEGLTGQLKTTLEVRYHVIHQHDDIKNIPPTILCVIFTEFSERHVIIEQKGIGLGDLKRTTYEKVCSLGGALMMVYVRDPGSRRLAPYRRYNADIDCVQSQQELKVVNDVGRFFSIFDTFTEFQLQCVRNIITETLEN